MAIGILQTAILSRMLTRTDFGLVGMLAVVTGLAEVLSDAGISGAIIARQDAGRERLSSVYVATLFTGLVLTVLLIVSTPLVVLYYREPKLAALLPWSALTFVINAVGTQFRILLQRELHFNQLAAVNTVGVVASFAMSIVLAAMGFGVWSLIFGPLLGSLCRSAVSVVYGIRVWTPVLRFRWSDLDGFVRFGLFQTGSQVCNYFYGNVDYLVVGRLLGAEQLGVYRIAYEIIVRPLSTLNPILTSVSLPLFAKRQTDDEALRRGYLEMIWLIAIIVIPVMLGLAAVSPSFTLTLFGAKFAAVAPLLPILAGVGIIRSLGNPVGALLIVKDKVHYGFYWNLISGIVNGVVFWFIAPQGLIAVCWAWLALSVVYTVAMWKNYYHDTIGLPYMDFLKTIAGSAVHAGIMALGVFALHSYLQGRLAPAAVLGICVAAGFVIYCGLALLIRRDDVNRVWQLVKASRETA